MNEYNADAGYLSAYVETGDGEMVMLSDPTIRWERGSTVVENVCFGSIVQVEVSGPSHDGWAGNIYYSLDNGSSWHQMDCSNCDGEVTMPLLVDRNGSPDDRFASCVGGRTCSVVVSDDRLCELILGMFGTQH